MARRATLIDTLRAHNPNLLLYDAGSFASDRPPAGEQITAFIVRALERLDYAAITLGPREFRYHPDTYPLDGELPILLSNVYRPTEAGHVPAARRFTIDEVSGIRVGTFSLLTPHLPQPVAKMLDGWEVRDPHAVAREMIDFFEAEGVEVIVLLSQLERTLLDPLLISFPEIDVAVLGHETTSFTGRPDECQAITLYGTPRGQAVASTELTIAPDGSTVATSKRMHDIARTIRIHPEIAVLVAEADAEIVALKKGDSLRRRQEARDKRENEQQPFVGGESCAGCHESEHESWLSSAHATAYRTLVDLGVQNSAECLPCHTVGYGQESGFSRADVEPDLAGVQCESCHKMDAQHIDRLTGRSAEAMCVSCHDDTNSPDFDLADYLEKIRHW